MAVYFILFVIAKGVTTASPGDCGDGVDEGKI